MVAAFAPSIRPQHSPHPREIAHLGTSFQAGFPTFAGTPQENFKLWKAQVVANLPFIHASAQQAAVLALLRGAALQAGVSYLEDNSQSRAATLLDYLSEKFLREEEVYAARNRLARLRQTGSVADYATAFSLIADVTTPRYEIELIAYFVRGLRSAILQASVLQNKPSSLHDAILCATRLGDHLITWRKKPGH